MKATLKNYEFRMACGTVEGAHFCNLEVVGSSHVINCIVEIRHGYGRGHAMDVVRTHILHVKK